MCKLWCLVFLMIWCTVAVAQRKEQLWLDFQLDYPFANRYLLEFGATYQTLLSNDDKWRSASISGTFEAMIFTFVDFTAEVPLGYTLQQEGSHSFEVAPIVGLRFHITQNKRINTRLLVRYQQRYFRQVEDEDWDVSNRTRLKGEAYICINGPNLFTDNLWYGILDYEEFIVLDKQLEERYANRRRARLGLGYRLNYRHRFEVIYTRQSSKNEIEGDFVSNDNVIQIRYKLFLNPAGLLQNNAKND